MKLLRTALAASVLVASSALGAQDLGIPVGSKAPDATLETLDGKPVALSRYIGGAPVVIEFWATWCGNCRELEPALHAAHRKYEGKVRFVGVAVGVNQSPERVRRYAEKHRLPLEVLYDRRGAAVRAYDVPATSYVVVLDRAGRVVYTGVGGSQNIDAAIRKAL